MDEYQGEYDGRTSELKKKGWNRYFLDIAVAVSERSPDPITKVGAVITDFNRRIVATGYNGFPIGVKESVQRWKKPKKYSYVLHAEENAILFSEGKCKGGTLYSTLFPCSECAKRIIQAGIVKVVAPKPSCRKGRHRYDLTHSMFKECGIEVFYKDL